MSRSFEPETFLYDQPIGEYIADGDMCVWERVAGGYIFRGEGADDNICTVYELVDEIDGPFVRLVPETPVVEPVIATVDDVKIGAVLAFTYTYVIDGTDNTSTGHASEYMAKDWINSPSPHCVISVVKAAPNAIEQKIASLKEYARKMDTFMTDDQAEFWAGYLLSLEDK